ncbi:Bardet-Biedl syndrome 4 isoform X2 [Cotesia typhae]|uniref:Bardet-Biedl syndrome 4 isoform X2 n=1 Tax=Cotesia typhae TaxID=2053667 RepID=UPI003D68EB83
MMIMNNNSLSNGVISQQLEPYRQSDSISERNRKAPDDLVISIYNWALHRHYVRHQYQMSEAIIQTEMIRSDGRNEYASYLKGMLLKKEGKVQESLHYFQKSYHVNSIKLATVRQIAKSLFLLGNHTQAIIVYSEAFQNSNPSEWRIYYNIGECYMALDYNDDAEKNLIKSIDLTRHVTPYLTLARLYVHNNEIKKAIKIYQMAVSFCSDRKEAVVKLGLLYLQTHNILKAFQQFGSMISQVLLPSNAMFAMAYIIQIHREYDIAISKFKASGPSFSESSYLWNDIGVCFTGKHKFLAATSCLKRANYLNPTALLASCNLGKVLIITNQFSSAAIYLCAAVAASTRNFIPFLLLSLAKSGQF